MSPIRDQLVEVIDCLPETEQSLLLQVALRFIADDVATTEDLDDIQAAREDYERGETISHDASIWD